MPAFSGKAPTLIVWIISLVLFVVAVITHFAKVNAQVSTWSWIIGFALLLIACRVRGL